MQRTFETPGAISLYVEIGSGAVRVTARDDADRTTVTVDGRDAEETTVEQRDGQVVVLGPQRTVGFLGGSGARLSVTVTVPSGSDLSTRLGSADLTASGHYGSARLRSGSGDVEIEAVGGDAVVETGSGDVQVQDVEGHLRVKSGSGDVQVRRATGTVVVSTGSGDVMLREAVDRAALKSGSGDISVHEAHADLTLSSASGDVQVGRVRQGATEVKNVSGDVRIGVPAGLPVWTDITCVTGRITSTLEGAGQPADGQPYLELRARTVSGDVTLEQL